MGLTIYYQKEKKGLKLVRCYGNDASVALPDHVDGQPFKVLGDYAFSEWKKKEEEDVQIYETDNGTSFACKKGLLCGNRIESVRLPNQMEELGKYAFYGCSRLKTLIFSDALKGTGTGVFNGCKLGHVEIFGEHGKSSCLKEIVGEVRYEMSAALHYRMEDGSEETAKLIFPEFYEEAVENTPARIIEKYFNGSGYKYRQCFMGREVDYQAYDQLFSTAVVEERPELVSEIAVSRLRYPYGLGSRSNGEYTAYIKEHAQETAVGFVKKHDLEALRFMTEKSLWSEPAMEASIEQAAGQQDGECMSYLMNEKHRLFPPRKKIFEL
ncbi:leucine-rich repeat domain-containing protein [Anaerostipes sp.]|uniref:leucine-rich repeat domain-containing protein n=1 Tax=Anaerostipes sp. TaxID=1872530 RepID=UPI0025BE9667|nr:leucine-rich repeat domain-containing protein [Anaerostipes sp.]MBS7007616.1 leucine-rich repeat protein [Anaerostipes sp.]